MVWSYTPQVILAQTLAVDTHRTLLLPGVTIAGQHTPNIVRAWVLEYPLVTPAEVGSMLAFVASHRGTYAAFDWTHIGDNVTYRVRFDADVTAEWYEPGRARLNGVRFVTVVAS